ncbi:MAG: DUF4258 domain-containing protein [Pseudobdellovibrionaceae bacterium]
MTVKFNGTMYTLQITNHAQTRMIERGVSTALLVTILEFGEVKMKPQQANAFWIFAEIPGRADNLVCVSLVTEKTDLVIKTVLINWRPL